MKELLAIGLLICPLLVFSQVKHNFEMSPENVDCHQLPTSFESNKQAIEVVESSTFRIRQSIKISRFRSPRSVKFYSCDGKTGYLIANETDDLRVIYAEIPKKVWDDFMNSDDPITFYADEIKRVYDPVE